MFVARRLLTLETCACALVFVCASQFHQENRASSEALVSDRDPALVPGDSTGRTRHCSAATCRRFFKRGLVSALQFVHLG